MLIGNCGKAPEVRTFDGGNKIANFTLATTKRYTDRNGQPVESTTWHNIQLNGKVVDSVAQYIQKGDPIYVEGELVSRSYTDVNNNTRTVYEVRASQIQLLRQKSEQQPQPAPQPQYAQSQYQAPAYNSVPDDDLPFGNR